MRTPAPRSLLSIALAFTALACSDDAADGSGQPMAGQGSEPGMTVTVEITSEGGEVAVGDASVEIPSGALAEPTEITVTVLSADDLASLPVDFEAAGPPVAFMPHGLQFEKPVTIRLGHDYSGSLDALSVLRLDDEEDTSWSGVDGASAEAHSIRFETRTFSVAQPVAEQAAAASDGGGPDAGSADGGGPDAGPTTDAGSGTDASIDAATPVDAASDSGAGEPDTGVDAGTIDAGVDAGAIDAGSGPVIHQFGSADNNVTASAVAVDSSDDVIIAGDTLASLDGAAKDGTGDTFVAKMTPAGTMLWTRQLRSGDTDTMEGVALDSTGAAYAVGRTPGLLGTANLGGVDAFVAKFASDGTPGWVRQFGTSSTDTASGRVAVNGSDGVLVAGTTAGTLGASSFGGGDAYLRRYDGATGGVELTLQFGSAGNDNPVGVAVDATGNVYVVGTTSGDFDGTNAGGVDGFVQQILSNDTLGWKRQFGGAAEDCITDVTVDGNGDVLVSGFTGTTCLDFTDNTLEAFVRKFTSTGTDGWTHSFGTTSEDRANAVTADALGNVLVAGRSRGDLAATNAGMHDFFVRKLDASQTVLWTVQIGGTGQDYAVGVAFDSGGDAVVGGRTTSMLGATKSFIWDSFVAHIPEP